MKTEILTAIAVLACMGAISSSLLHPRTQVSVAANSTQPVNSHRSGSNIAVAGSADAKSPGNQLVRQAAAAINQSQPLKAKLRYKIEMFGQRFAGPGMYFQKGQGTRLTRMQFQFGFNDQNVQLHQFCDGDHLYSLTIAGGKSDLESVDLRQLNNREPEKKDEIMNWLKVGSLTGLLEQLSANFQFEGVESADLDSIPVLITSGRWNPRSLERLLEGQLEPGTITAESINWAKLPKHLPHQVRLTLGNDQRFPMFPYRIVFQQIITNDPSSPVVQDVAVLELYQVQLAPEVSDAMFQLPSVDSIPKDATEFYQKRINQFTR